MAELPIILLSVYAVIFFMTILIARRTPGTVEPNTGEATDLEDFEPVDFKSLLDSEMPYIPYN